MLNELRSPDGSDSGETVCFGPPLKAVINKLDHTNDAREIHHNLLQVLQHKQKEQELLVPTEILMTPVYASVAYRRAASLGMPVETPLRYTFSPRISVTSG